MAAREMLNRFMAKRPDLALRNTTHGLSRVHKSEYRSWKDMRMRCYNPNNRDFKDYGARGIKICDRWGDFSLFYKDMGDKPPEHTLDRINVNDDYSPVNCRWADNETQANNKRCTPKIFFMGREQTISQWSREFAIDRRVVEYRLKQGIPLVEALKKIDLRKIPREGIRA